MILREEFFGGIKINDYIVALTSNKNSSKGEDKIIFFNIHTYKIFKEIKGYSFTKSQTNLSLISNINDDNKKLLICACTKYVENQKNGILLIRIEFDDREEDKIFEVFYETNFKVHCFCPILESKNKNDILDIKRKVITKFFFVGGYNKLNNEGLIKLYKINYNENDFDKTGIEYIKDIEIENEKINFNGPINCMIQSKLNGKIILTNMDGSVYLFSSPNIINY